MSARYNAKTGTLPRPSRLHDDGDRHPLALGCHACPDLKACGGLRIAAATFNCLDRCCGGLERCNAVCPAKPEAFVDRVREVGGFDVADVPGAPHRPLPSLAVVVPMLYSGVSRLGYAGAAVALPLSKMLRREDGLLRFESMEELAEEFRFAPGATVVLSGTDEDSPLERWWRMEKSGRRRAARGLSVLGVHAATSLNFSMFTDRPRHDDLHSAKRIGLVWQEMVDEGLPTALHVNARTETDWLHWTGFIATRPEVDAIAYEFATPSRPHWHAAKLIKLVQDVGRPIRLVVRGGRAVLPLLTRVFDTVTVLDTTAYMKTMNRQRADVRANGDLDWYGTRTRLGQPLDELFEHNLRHVSADLMRVAHGICAMPPA